MDDIKIEMNTVNNTENNKNKIEDTKIQVKTESKLNSPKEKHFYDFLFCCQPNENEQSDLPPGLAIRATLSKIIHRSVAEEIFYEESDEDDEEDDIEEEKLKEKIPKDTYTPESRSVVDSGYSADESTVGSLPSMGVRVPPDLFRATTFPRASLTKETLSPEDIKSFQAAQDTALKHTLKEMGALKDDQFMKTSPHIELKENGPPSLTRVKTLPARQNPRKFYTFTHINDGAIRNTLRTLTLRKRSIETEEAQ